MYPHDTHTCGDSLAGVAKRPRPDWNALTDALWARCGGHCEITGIPLDRDGFNRHHRRPKGSGGTYLPDTDTLPNLLALDPGVHNGRPHSVHQDPAWSRPRGYLLSKLDRRAPLLVPVLYRGRYWALLLGSGRVVRLAMPVTLSP